MCDTLSKAGIRTKKCLQAGDVNKKEESGKGSGSQNGKLSQLSSD